MRFIGFSEQSRLFLLYFIIQSLLFFLAEDGIEGAILLPWVTNLLEGTSVWYPQTEYLVTSLLGCWCTWGIVFRDHYCVHPTIETISKRFFLVTFISVLIHPYWVLSYSVTPVLTPYSTATIAIKFYFPSIELLLNRLVANSGINPVGGIKH